MLPSIFFPPKLHNINTCPRQMLNQQRGRGGGVRDERGKGKIKPGGVAIHTHPNLGRNLLLASRDVNTHPYTKLVASFPTSLKALLAYDLAPSVQPGAGVVGWGGKGAKQGAKNMCSHQGSISNHWCDWTNLSVSESLFFHL